MNKFKVGDQVFVVPQNQRHSTQKPFSTEVMRVGKKYGYIKRYSQEVPFHLDSGVSHHKDCNTRANGYGFDVYSSEQEYLKDYFKMKKRLSGCYTFPKLPPMLVDQINALLDEYSID